MQAKQLAALLGAPEDVHWLSGDITRDTASTLRNYLLYELEVTEWTPEQVLPRLNKEFLEAQTDEWTLKLYEFLGGQPALVRQGRVSNIPLVRVEDGTHVLPDSDGQPRAFLPSEIKTDFPTVPRSVCSTAKSLEFLKALGLTEPDAVDDVVRNIIPKYKRETVEVDGDEYEGDLVVCPLNKLTLDLRGVSTVRAGIALRRPVRPRASNRKIISGTYH